MFLTLLGVFLLISPFFALVKFKDPKIGFFHITLFILFIQLIIGVISQALHIFNYQVVIVLNIFVFISSLILFRPSKLALNFIRKPDWALIFVISIAFLALYTVHYRYTGAYATVNNPINESETPLNYSYPYFSDEWYAIAFIKDSIASQSLPIRNPIWHGKFTNLEMPFHSLIAEITLLLKLNPVTGYVPQSIAINLLIIVMIYFFLSVNGVKKILSAIASLGALYIANAGLLPGLWTLLPLSVGIIFLLLSLSFYSLKRKFFFELASFLTLIFYPPLIIFIIVLLGFQLFGKSLTKSLKLLSHYVIIVAVSAFFISMLFLFDTITVDEVLNSIINRIFYTSFIGSNFISSFPIYYIIPIPILMLAVLGLPVIIKERKALAIMLAVSLVFWTYYSFTPYRFIIEFERVVIVASLLIVLVAGFGLNTFFDFLGKITSFNSIYLQRIILLAFLPLLLIYTESNSWGKFTAHPIGSDVVSASKPLANKYIHPDDLSLFSDIKNKNFLAPAWKGTVIGVATDNLPLAMKDGTISQPNQNYFSEFINMSCIEKLEFTKQRDLAYAYTPQFDCPGFRVKGKSAEGLILYMTDL